MTYLGIWNTGARQGGIFDAVWEGNAEMLEDNSAGTSRLIASV